MGNKMMTGQYKHSTRHALRILKDGEHLLTQPHQILHKCYSSMQDHHNTPPPSMSGQLYPWELPGAQDRYRLETSAQEDTKAHQQGLYKMITDQTEFSRILSRLGTGKQPGPDNIPNEIIQASPPSSKIASTCSYRFSGPRAAPQTGGKTATQYYCSKTKAPSWISAITGA
jgi:hypothetical protein